MNIFNKIIIIFIPFLPKWLVKVIANKYIAGTTIEDAILVIKHLNNRGESATLDILGEHTKNKNECIDISNKYIEILTQIDKNNLDCNISVKPSHIGSDIDNKFLGDNFRKIQKHAFNLNNFIRIDMEDSSLTDLTLSLCDKLYNKNTNIGTVIQAYLHRSESDINLLRKNINIRLCKGIYNEDDTIAFKNPEEINDNYIKLLETAFKKNIYVGIATHDKTLIKRCLNLIKNKNISNKDFEFQYLYGVPMEDMISIYKKNNYKVRAYVPFGINWYDYSVRRIKENPKIATYVIKNLFK